MKTSDIMTRELVTVTAEKTLDECLRLDGANGIFHLIVLDERGELPGDAIDQRHFASGSVRRKSASRPARSVHISAEVGSRQQFVDA